MPDLLRSYAFKIAVGTVLALALLSVLHHKPWRTERGGLKVGYLPVTCHLTCPVTDFATKTTETGTRFVSVRFSDFPTVTEALKTRDMDATFMVAPLAMRLREQGVPIKIVYLGHRDGSTVMVHKDSGIRDIADLRGKIFARPSPASNQYLVILKLMEDAGMAPDEIEFRDMPPPEMSAALATREIDAYFVGEPHAAKSEMVGHGRVLYHAKDIWPEFISCVLVVREELIEERPDVVRDLVRGIAESGEWADQNRLGAAKVAAPYFRQDQALLEYVLTTPPDRVSYSGLTPTREEMEEIMKYAVKAGVLDREIDVDELLDLRFIPETIRPARIVAE